MKILRVALALLALALTAGGDVGARSRPNGNGLNYSSAVFIGTSITLGVRPGVTANQTIPYLVGNNLGYVPSIDTGIGGDTSTGMVARFGHDVLAYTPAMISIEAGTNEPGAGISVGTYTANVTIMIQQAQSIGAIVTLFVSPYTGDGGGPGMGLDGLIEPYRVAMRGLAVTFSTPANPVYLFDTYNDFIALPPATQTAYFNPGDTEHFSPAGLAWNAGLVGTGAYLNSFRARTRPLAALDRPHERRQLAHRALRRAGPPTQQGTARSAPQTITAYNN